MKRRKTTDIISLIYIVMVILHLVITSQLPYHQNSWTAKALASTNIALIIISMLFAFSSIFMVAGIFRKYKRGQRIVISQETRLAFFLWILILLFELGISATSAFGVRSEIAGELYQSGSMSTEGLTDLYLAQEGLTGFFLGITSISAILMAIAVKTRKFVSSIEVEITFKFVDDEQKFVVEIQQEPIETIEVATFVEFNDLFANEVLPMAATELHVFALKTQQLKEAKKGMTPPIDLFA